MIRRAPGREAWLPTGIVACALLVAAPLLALAGDDPHEWLEKMTRALATRNYDGTFFHLSNGQVEAMRIVHRVQGGRVTERLQSLEGSGREYVRDNDRLTCYLPDKHKILVATRQSRGPFLSSLPHFGSGADRFYRIVSLPQGRVLGRPVRVIAVNPKDQYRFGYRLWLDEKTAMPLKTQLCDSHGQVLEQILFAKLDMPQWIPDRDLKPTVSTADMRWVIQSPSQSASPAIAAFRASELPPGFELAAAGAQMLGNASEPAEHLVYTDGLATVSVFVEAGEQPAAESGGPDASNSAPMQGLARVGSGFVFSTVVQGHQVTAVGEVPAETVEYIAHSVKALSGAEMPRH